MPFWKSAPSLKLLCFQTVSRYYDTIYHSLPSLPNILLADILTFLQEENELNHLNRLLHASIFIHSDTKELCWLSMFDMPRSKVFDNLAQIGKNLTKLVIEQRYRERMFEEVQPECVIKMVQQLPQIRYLDFQKHKWCTDGVVTAIATHCLQLQHLNITGTCVTPDVCLLVLRNLSSLEVFEYSNWPRLLPLLNQEFNSNQTYSLKQTAMTFSHGFDVINATVIFPNLRIFGIRSLKPGFSFGAYIAGALRNTSLRKLIGLHLTFITHVNIKDIDFCCPMLQSLSLTHCSFSDESDNNEYLQSSSHLLFENLRKLCIKNVDISELHLQMLLSCRNIEELELNRCQTLTDSLITQLAMSNLRNLKLYCCNLVSSSAITKLVVHQSPLNELHCEYCEKINQSDCYAIRALIKRRNLDLKFTHRAPAIIVGNGTCQIQ